MKKNKKMNAGRIKTKAFKRTKSIQETITDQILFEKNA